jgi:membrane protease YdiL (CAAX protease family)
MLNGGQEQILNGGDLRGFKTIGAVVASMAEATTGIKQLFWHPEQKRLRALFRVPATFGLILLAAQVILAVVGLVEGVALLPTPMVVPLTLILLAGSVVAIAWFVDRRVLADIGLEVDSQWGRDAVAGFVIGLGMAAVIVVALRLAGMATLEGTRIVEEPILILGGGSPVRSLLYGLLFFVGVGALEEIIVRGYLLVNVAEGVRGYLPDDRTAVLAAIAVTASIFGALHAANPGGTTIGLVNITIAGLLLGATYAVTERLAFPIGLHIAWNFGLGPVFGLPVSGLTTETAFIPVRIDGPTFVTGGSFGPEGGLVMLLALAYAGATFLWWSRRQYGRVTIDGSVAIPDLWTDESDDS